MTSPDRSITVTKDGPYDVRGSVPIRIQRIAPDEHGESVAWEEGDAIDAPAEYSLCRCGRSSTKPFCDKTHERIGFDGTETASREPYLEQAYEIDGPGVILTDAEPLCAFARFCDYGNQVWNLVEGPSEDDVALGIQEAERCPSGRLVAWKRDTQTAVEPELEPSIGLIEDPALGVSAGIWVRGGIPVVSEDGTPYEVRNRVTLCRCGSSQNKPFCDGSHASIRFQDGLDAASRAEVTSPEARSG